MSTNGVVKGPTRSALSGPDKPDKGRIGRGVMRMKYGLGSDVWKVSSKAQALHNSTISSRTTNGILKDREVKMRNRKKAEHLTILS